MSQSIKAAFNNAMQISCGLEFWQQRQIVIDMIGIEHATLGLLSKLS